MSLFPMIQPREAKPLDNKGLYVEVAWDYENNMPLYKNGNPVLVERADAVLVWAWNALQTVRYEHEIFTWDYANEAEKLRGRPVTDELKQSEAPRFVRECLLINPYITEVRDIVVNFENDKLEIACVINTVYGEVSAHV